MRRTPHPLTVFGWLALASVIVLSQRTVRPAPDPNAPPLLAPLADTIARHPPVVVTSEWWHDPVEVLATPADSIAADGATAHPPSRRDRLPRPFAALRSFASPLIMPRLRVPRALTPDFPALRALAARARPGEPVTVTLTAYCLHGTTNQGTRTRAGIVAADPRIFPMARHVELFAAGRYLGRFRIEDTGGAVHGAHIDIWTPDCDDAERFGTRPGVASLVALGE
ncbi:hypothetical protein tb265_31530 [Gemmatimonadetes bacterium T265]|nr:hypothetical protein tb265_31530 [Gemmatimonadetes bacterium T265]